MDAKTFFKLWIGLIILALIIGASAIFARSRIHESPNDTPRPQQPAPVNPFSTPDVPTLIRIEREWWEGAGGELLPPDLLDDDLRCWRVRVHDFPGTEGAWECWRCTVLSGNLKGTVRWEWRVPRQEEDT